MHQRRSFGCFFLQRLTFTNHLQAARSTDFTRRAKRLHSSDKARAALPKLELLKEASNTIGHEPDHVSQHKYYKHFWNNKKKVALAKKLKLGMLLYNRW